jgi:hypothetical protein
VSPPAAPNTSPPRTGVLLVLLGGAIHLGFIATQLSTASNKLLLTEVLGPPAAVAVLYRLWRALRGSHEPSSLLAAIQMKLGNTTSLVIVGAGLAYLLGTGLLMVRVSYDIWGAFVAVPVIGWIGVRVVKRTLVGDLVHLQRAAIVGLVAKAVGTAARYWVASDAYGGAADAFDYHLAGKQLAGELYHGHRSIIDIIPHTQGTKFIGEVTGLLYSMVGSSRLAAFFWFGLLGYVGVLLIVKAACTSVTGLATKRYAWLCFLAPSLIYWPSSIGKEAWISLMFGATASGAARVFTGRPRASVPWIVCGAVGAAMVRPHMALLGLAGLVVATLIGLVARRMGPASRGGRPAIVVITLLALVALVGLGRATLKFLNPEDDGTSRSVSTQITDILNTAGERTSEGGSAFTPMEIRGPIDYPQAILRTLTRPLLYEIVNVETMLPALEMTSFVALCLLSWRRIIRLPLTMLRSPFVAYAAVVCLMFGLGWASFGNLAVLVRQRSIVFPLMLLFPCLPAPAPVLPEPRRGIAPGRVWQPLTRT